MKMQQPGSCNPEAGVALANLHCAPPRREPERAKVAGSEELSSQSGQSTMANEEDKI